MSAVRHKVGGGQQEIDIAEAGVEVAVDTGKAGSIGRPGDVEKADPLKAACHHQRHRFGKSDSEITSALIISNVFLFQ